MKLTAIQFIIELTSTSTPSADALLRTVRSLLPAQLKAKFDAFRPTLLEAHGIFVEGSPAPSASGSSTPARYAPAPPGEVRSSTPNQSAAAAAQQAEKKVAVGNTKTVEASAQLQVSADDLWNLLTDEGRVPMWSRSAAKVRFSLFSSLIGCKTSDKVHYWHELMYRSSSSLKARMSSLAGTSAVQSKKWKRPRS